MNHSKNRVISHNFHDIITILAMIGGVNMSFGTNLEQLRKAKRVSQATLGMSLGLTQQMISTYEKDLSSPNIDTLIQLADYFETSIDNLVEHTCITSHPLTRTEEVLSYFNTLCETDQARCLLILKTILTDRQL